MLNSHIDSPWQLNSCRGVYSVYVYWDSLSAMLSESSWWQKQDSISTVMALLLLASPNYLFSYLVQVISKVTEYDFCWVFFFGGGGSKKWYKLNILWFCCFSVKLVIALGCLTGLEFLCCVYFLSKNVVAFISLQQNILLYTSWKSASILRLRQCSTGRVWCNFINVL